MVDNKMLVRFAFPIIPGAVLKVKLGDSYCIIA